MKENADRRFLARRCRRSFAWVLISAVVLPAMAAPPGWHDANAQLRFKLQRSRGASHPEAGYTVVIPDGGILPRPTQTSVFDAEGNRMGDAVLWHDPARGLGLVVQWPERSPTLTVYIRRGTNMKVWTPDSNLKPGIVAYLKPNSRGIEAARAMATSFPPGDGVYFKRSPVMGLRPIPEGLGGSFSDYVLGHVAVTDPGRIWVACMTKTRSPAEPCELRIDGKAINMHKQGDKPAGTGAWVELDEGIHRVELFHASPSEAQRGFGWMWWRLPHTATSELEPDLQTGRPRWMARPLTAEELVQSGEAVVSDAESADGSPIPVLSIEPQGYFWFGERPVILYNLTARQFSNPEETTYTWQLPDGATITGRRHLLWLFEKGRTCRITLTVTAGTKRNSCSVPFQTFCSGDLKSDINIPDVRDLYREAFVNMFKAYPRGRNPTAQWSGDLWDLFYRMLEPGRGDALLAQVFNESWDALQTSLSEDRRRQLKDLFLAVAATHDPGKALAWTERFISAAASAEERGHWKVKQAELYMYYLDDIEAARALIAELTSGQPTTAAARRAHIRKGDIAFLEADYRAAVDAYREAQSIAERLAEQAAKRQALRAGSRQDTEDWRVDLIQDTSLSETTRELILNGYLLEARATLDDWELQFPLSKLSGDYVIVESQYLMATGDYVRADKQLTAYCKAMQMSNALPEAIRLKMRCMRARKLPESDIEDFVAAIKKRFPYHPVSKELERSLEAEQDTFTIEDATGHRF